jgi:hypothetical protein
MNTHINPEFKKHFDKLAKRTLALRQRLNAWKEEGRDLEERLDEELRQFSPWRFELYDSCANAVDGFNEKQKEQHRCYIMETEFYQVVQEAPFYWRNINKPEGYSGDAEMMNLIYRNRYEGETPFGMLLHKDAANSLSCEAVRNRRSFLREQIIMAGGEISLALPPDRPWRYGTC